MSMDFDEEIAVLFHAATLGRTDIISKVISGYRVKGLDEGSIGNQVSSIRPEDGFTPLHIAAAAGHNDVIRALLQVGADLTIQSLPINNEKGKLPYELATSSAVKAFNISFFEQVALGNLNKIERFLKGGIPTNIVDGSATNDSPLHWACSFNNFEVAKLLIRHGCDINFCNSIGQTPLFIACKNGNFDLIELLLSEGAVNIKDVNGSYPKDLLKESSDSKIVALLESLPLLTAITSNESPAVERNGMNHKNGLDIPFEPLVERVDNSEINLDRPQLVLWPPVQIQHYLSNHPLELHTLENLLICVANIEIDIFPLLTWSGLMDTLDRIGFTAQVKRSPIDAKIRLNINSYICPKRHHYEISITSKDISITANDSTSLLYAVQTFVQLLNLQCVIKITNSNNKIVKIPSIYIQDWADIPNRGILWSYRSHARSNTAYMRDTVELLSKLHINMLFLTIDTTHDTDSDIDNQPTTKIYALDEVCRRHAVELIPTVNITSIYQKLPKETLNNFSCELLALFLLYEEDKISSELNENSDKNAIVTACINSCTDLFTEIKARGFHTIVLIPSSWVSSIVDIQTLALIAGLHVTITMLDDVLPSRLFIKPLILLEEFITTIANYTSTVSKKSLSISIVPVFVDSDYLYPSILSKLYCVIFGGFSWNRIVSFDVLNIKQSVIDDSIDYYVPNDYGELIRPVLIYLFPAIGQSSNITKLLLDIFTGNINKLIDNSTVDTNNKSNNNISVDLLDGKPIDTLVYSTTERMLWGIATSKYFLSNGLSPTKSNATYILRICRKILTIANWKLGVNGKRRTNEQSNEYPIEIEEYFTVIFIYTIICKAIVLSYNIIEKSNKSNNPSFSFISLMTHLAPGIKSDIANSLLSAIEYISIIWKKRYDITYTNYKQVNNQYTDNKSINKWLDYQINQLNINNIDVFNDKYLRLKYLLHDKNNQNILFNIPLIDLFKCMIDGLQMPYSVDEVLKKVLNN